MCIRDRISAPVWSAPAAGGSTVACPADAVAPGAADIMDNCGRTISGVLSGESTTPTCNGTKTYTYTYTACDGTTQDWVYTYTISAPVWSAPAAAGSTVACPADAVAPGAADITDNCGRTISGVLTGESTTPVCNGTKTYTYTYTACDGTTQDWVYMYTIFYNSGLTAPANETDTISNPSEAVDPGAPDDITDACGRTVSAVLVGSETTPDPITCEGTVVWTYRYTACDETTTADWTKTYIVSGTCDFQLTVLAPAEPVSCGDTVTYHIRAEGFSENVGAVQFPLTWNAYQLEYVSSTFDSSLYIPGGDIPEIGLESDSVFVYVWGDGNPPFGSAIPDSSIIMSVSFRVKAFGSLPLDISEEWPDPSAPFLTVLDSDFNDLPVVTNDTAAVECNTVCDIFLYAEAPATASCGDLITVDIKANGMYSNVNDLQFSINWDTLQLQYVSSSFEPSVYAPTVDEPLLAHPASLMPPTGPDGAATYMWADFNSPYGVPLKDSTVIMSLTFNVINDGTINISITNDPTEISANDNINFDPINVFVTGDAIEVVDTLAPVAPSSSSDPTIVSCLEDAIPPIVPDASDNCDGTVPGVLVSVTDTPDPLTCEGTRVYTYSYTDMAGNEADDYWVYTYTIEYEDFTMPANDGSVVACVDDITTPTPPAVNDHCGNVISPTGPVIGGTYAGCEGTITYTWNYVDCEGNTHDWVYTYTIQREHSTMQTNVSCNGGANGSATVTPVGCAAGYTYSWNTSPVQTGATATGLAAGTYTVIVTDNSGCTSSTSVTITQPAVLTITGQPSTTNATVTCGTSGQILSEFTAWNTGITYSGGTAPVNVSTNYVVVIDRNDSLVTTYNGPIATAPHHDGGYTQVTWTVTDSCGNTASISATFNVVSCPRVSGKLNYYRDNAAVNGVTVRMLQGTNIINSNITSVDGSYSVLKTPLSASGIFDVAPEEIKVCGTCTTGTVVNATNLRNIYNISVQDVQAIQAHVASGVQFTNIYQRVAANVTLGSPSSESNNRLNLADASTLSQAINGNLASQQRLCRRAIPKDSFDLLTNGAPTTLPRSWGLVPPGVSGGQNPSQYGDYPTRIKYNPLDGAFINQDFTVVWVGDVVYTAPTFRGNGEVRYAGLPLIWKLQDVELVAGESVEADFSIEQMQELSGWQFGLQFDPEYLKVDTLSVSGALSLDADVNFGLYRAQEGEIRSLWAESTPRSLNKGESVFKLRFTVLRGGKNLSEVLRMEDDMNGSFALTDSRDEVGVLLTYESQTKKGQSPVLYQNVPNPFNRETLIRFELPSDSPIQLSIHDITGRLIRRVEGSYSKGIHEVRFDKGDLGQYSGILYYTLSCGDFTATRKMVVIE